MHWIIKVFLIPIFFFFLLSDIDASTAKLGSLSGRPDSEIKRLAKGLSSVTTPEILSSNKALQWLDFEFGFELALYHFSSGLRSIAQNSFDGTYYLPFLFGKIGWGKGFDSEIVLFLPGKVKKFSIFSSSLKWVPSFLNEDKYFFTPAIRQSYTYTKFDQYDSNTWTTDLILSTQKIWGIPFYGGGSFIKVFGEYDASILDATQTRKPQMWTGKYFFGIDHPFKLSKKLALATAFEVGFTKDAQIYALKTAFNF